MNGEWEKMESDLFKKAVAYKIQLSNSRKKMEGGGVGGAIV